MHQFIEKHRERIAGVPSGFDRLAFHGLPRRLSRGAGLNSGGQGGI